MRKGVNWPRKRENNLEVENNLKTTWKLIDFYCHD